MVNTSNANISNISFWFKVEWKSHPEEVQQDCKIVLCPEYSLHLVSFIRFTEFTFLINFMQITWSNLLSPQISDSSNIYSVGLVLSDHTRRSNNYEIHIPRHPCSIILWCHSSKSRFKYVHVYHFALSQAVTTSGLSFSNFLKMLMFLRQKCGNVVVFRIKVSDKKLFPQISALSPKLPSFCRPDFCQQKQFTYDILKFCEKLNRKV